MPTLELECNECPNKEEVNISVIDSVKKIKEALVGGDRQLKCKECGDVQENIPSLDEEFDNFEWL